MQSPTIGAPGAARTSRRGLAAARTSVRGLAAITLCLALAACAGGPSLPSDVPDDLRGTPSDDVIPTFPPDDLASGVAACIDPSTMAIVDQLRAPDADVVAILAANRDALIEGLGELDSADPKTTEWRDALLSALMRDDLTGAAAQVAVLAAGDLTITPC